MRGQTWQAFILIGDGELQEGLRFRSGRSPLENWRIRNLRGFSLAAAVLLDRRTCGLKPALFHWRHLLPLLWLSRIAD